MPWLFFIVLVDAIGFGIILPLLPVFAFKFQLDAFQLGLLTAVFSFFQLITAPILGALSDKFGRKTIIVICLFFIGISYFILAEATTFTEAFLARALAGLFTGNISVVLASASDLSSEENRAKYMGYIGAGTGIGFVLGPIVGGFLAGGSIEEANLKLVFNMAASFTMLSSLLAFLFLKETLKIPERKYQFSIFTKMKRITNIILFNREVMFLLYLSALMWFAFTSINVFLTTWSVFKFQLTPITLGIIGTSFAFIAAVVQVISPKFIQGGKAIFLGFQISAFSILSILLEPGIVGLVFIVVFLSIGIGILFPNLNSTISLYGSQQQRGFILGLSQSASTLGQTIGPIIIGLIYLQVSSMIAFLTIGMVFMLSSFITLHYMLLNKKSL